MPCQLGKATTEGERVRGVDAGRVPLAYLAGDGGLAEYEAAAEWARREGYRPWAVLLEAAAVGYAASFLEAGEAFLSASAVVPVGSAPFVVEAAGALGLPVLDGLRHAA